jgi:FAD/FMN-containing dehydrogenase
VAAGHAARLNLGMNDPTHVQRMLRVAGDVAECVTQRRAGRIDVSGLDHVLRVDAGARRCVAEPGVSFRALWAATSPHGLAPCVLPQRESLTLGDAVVHCIVESSEHGAFHRSCLEYEVVTGIGDVVRCGRRHDADLFRSMHGSHGALGILTELTFELVLVATLSGDARAAHRLPATRTPRDQATFARLERRMDPEGVFRGGATLRALRCGG